MLIPNLLYVISGTLWAIELLPQLLRTYKRKKVGDISLLFSLICFISFLCFMTAIILCKNWVLVFTHIFPFICNILFLLQVLTYRRN